jgi:hypothetical protein
MKFLLNEFTPEEEKAKSVHHLSERYDYKDDCGSL